MTASEALIMAILEQHGGEMRGLDIVRASGGELARGVVYVHLQRLEDAGLVVSREEPKIEPHIGIRRRLYKRAVQP